MNNLYFNREQSQAKHEILRRYLVPFSNKILSTWHSLDFIDGFSGPWENNDHDNLTDTSIGIALRTLSEVAHKMGHTKTDRRIRCIFNENDPETYTRLKNFLDQSETEFPLIKIKSFRGKFEDNARKIKSEANHAFQLLFVDPTGYSGFPPSSLEHFKGRSSELIINVMRSFIERFVSGNHEKRESALIGLVGGKRAKKLLENELTIEVVENEYLCLLRETLGYKFAGYSPIHNPNKNQIQFNLAYATNHPEGMEVMRSAEYAALSDYDRTRFKKSLEDEMDDLFSSMHDEMEIWGPYIRCRKEHLNNAEAVLTDIIAKKVNGIAFSELVAMTQQSLYLKRSELGNVIVGMAAKKLVNAPWLKRNGRKPRIDDLIILLK